MASIPTPSPPIELNNDDDDGDSDSDSSAYVSFTDTESEEEEEDPAVREQRASEERQRQAERARVLEAAGLVVEADPHNAPPIPPRRKKSVRSKTRRAPPPVPETHQHTLPSERDLPPTPPSSNEPAQASDIDAYDKYESYRRSSSHLTGSNRFSMVSMASSEGPSSPVSTVAPSLSPSVTRDGESHISRLFGGSGLNSFLGRTASQASSASDKKPPLVISGPITATSDGSIARSNSPAFGMVMSLSSTATGQTTNQTCLQSWSSIVDKTALQGIPDSERRRQEVRSGLSALSSHDVQLHSRLCLN